MNPKIIAWLAYAAAAVVLLSAVLFGVRMIYGKGYDAGNAVGMQQLANERTKNARALAAAQADADKRYRDEIAKGQTAAHDQLVANDKLTDENQRLKARVPYAITQYRPAPGAGLQPLPRCIWTTGAVGLLNSAAGTGSAAAVPTGSATGGTIANPQTDEALDSGVSTGDVMAWSIDFGTRCRGIESQLRKVIDLWPREVPSDPSHAAH